MYLIPRSSFLDTDLSPFGSLSGVHSGVFVSGVRRGFSNDDSWVREADPSHRCITQVKSKHLSSILVTSSRQQD